MKELELLGLGPDGESVTLNDAEGNRYLLPITDELRAALRATGPLAAEANPDMSPREIQAKIRGGVSVEDICEITGRSFAHVSALAHPIMVERQYTVAQALTFPIAHDSDGLTLEELVVSRLLSRGVSPEAITWDSYRKSDEPWTLAAIFAVGEREHRATWHVDLDRRTLSALDDEATWLSETQISNLTSTWRAANTPPVRDINDSSNPLPQDGPAEPQDSRSDLDAMLSSLDSQRGQTRPMPTAEDEEAFEGAHPAPSEPEAATDATILTLPARPGLAALSPKNSDSSTPVKNLGEEESSSFGSQDNALSSFENREIHAVPGHAKAGSESSERHSQGGFSAENQGENGGDSAVQETLLDIAHEPEKAEASKGKKRTLRPSMPSWDEIVFGKKD